MREEKQKMKASIRERLYGSPLFFPVRTAYQCIFDRAKLVDRMQMRAFYAPFPGSVNSARPGAPEGGGAMKIRSQGIEGS